MFYDIIDKTNISRLCRTNRALINGAVRGVVTRFHGYGCDTMNDPPDRADILLAGHGILTFHPFYDPWAWANDAALGFIDRLLRVLCDMYGLDPSLPLVVCGESMGGLTSLVYTRRAGVSCPLRLAACTADCPVCDLDAIERARPDILRAFCAAYGSSALSYDDTLERISPIKNIAALPRIPYKIVQGGRDCELDPSHHAEAFVPAARAAGLDVNYEFIPEMQHCAMPDGVFERYYGFICDIIEKESPVK